MLKSLWSEWIAWWATVTPEFAFLLALPFLVLAAGFVGHVWRNCGRRPPAETDAAPRQSREGGRGRQGAS